MTNTDIQKIRQLLKSLEWIHVAFFKEDDFCPSCKRTEKSGHYKDCQLAQALALLPCETCGGTRRVVDPTAGDHHINPMMSCPDCQPKPCKTCEERRSCGVGEKCPDCKS